MRAMWICPAYKKGIGEGKERGRRTRKGQRKREMKEDPTTSSSDFRHFDGWSSSSRELKSVYSMKAMLQEVGIFLLWLIAFIFRQVFKGTV